MICILYYNRDEEMINNNNLEVAGNRLLISNPIQKS